VTFSVVDLFSGGGGMSFGFHAHRMFDLVGAADAQIGKPSSKRGSLACNNTYELNIGLTPVQTDLAAVDPRKLRRSFGFEGELDVLAACPPCTGFSRATPTNHLVDDNRNILVARTAFFVEEFRPRVLIMENARELLTGNFAHHFEFLRDSLEVMGYSVHAKIHMLTGLGLPQIRERALVIATAPTVELHTLDDLWAGFSINESATTVRRAIGGMRSLTAGQVDRQDPMHASPTFSSPATLERLRAIPKNGGSWRDLWVNPKARHHLTAAMRRRAADARWGDHPDVYGRMRWDRPAPTVKRECGHVGNGRYAHPEQHRLLSLREMAIINGFPRSYQFGGHSLANKYRHVGDAVPPLVSYQLAWLSHWILTGQRPEIADVVLPDCSFTAEDIVEAESMIEAA
jgi:DNA (cytosine-5)-methyltransferase 1